MPLCAWALCCAVLCCAVLCCAVLCCTITNAPLGAHAPVCLGAALWGLPQRQGLCFAFLPFLFTCLAVLCQKVGLTTSTPAVPARIPALPLGSEQLVDPNSYTCMKRNGPYHCTCTPPARGLQCTASQGPRSCLTAGLSCSTLLHNRLPACLSAYLPLLPCCSSKSTRGRRPRPRPTGWPSRTPPRTWM
jgi:hypothetical protein